jgi:photosynthetic reaction center cytochrome c subunit
MSGRLPAGGGFAGSADSNEPTTDAKATAPVQSDAAARAEMQRALDEIKRQIGERGAEPAEKVFRHIEVLKGKPASRLPGMMGALTGLLGVRCSHCHIPEHWDSEQKHAKQVTREQFAMQADINSRYFGGKGTITCWTCHRGHPIPEALPPARK